MSLRTEKVEATIKEELGVVIARSAPLEDALATITKVSCSADLKYACISLSVLPENRSGSALKTLKKHSREYEGALRKRLRLRAIPKLNWVIDGQERYVVELEKTYQELKQAREGETENHEPSTQI